ncbi:hypothetical protein AAVH_43828, partial [Aphelenchoides avenae]
MKLLQTARKELNVVSLQRQASAILQELRKACRKDDSTSRDSARDNPLRADDCESTFTEFSCRSMPDDTRDPFATPDEYNRQTSSSRSTKLAPVYENLSEPFSGYEEEDITPDQNIESSEVFDNDSKDTQTKNIGTYAILSNKENGTHRTTLLECVKVVVGRPTDKTQQCETVLVLDSASYHVYFKQSLCEKLRLPCLGPTKLSVATFLSSDEIPVDTFVSQLRIRKSNGKTICLKAP